MKIIDVDALHIRIEDPNIGLFDGSYDDCLIVVRTDEGLTGIGEVESLPAAIQGIVRSRAAHNHARGLRELLIGQDPTDPERLWQLMYDATDYVGRRGLMMHAIGGIDLALWDITGQAAGKPVSELRGGRCRERVEAYGTIYPMAREPEAVRAQIAAARDLGLRNFKFAADPWWMDDLDATARLLQAAPGRGRHGGQADRRRQPWPTGPRRSGCAFCRCCSRSASGSWRRRCRWTTSPATRAWPAAACRSGWATWASPTWTSSSRRWTAARPPSASLTSRMVGGFTHIRRIAAAAAERGKPVITHGYKTNIEIAANLHFLANHRDAEVLEYSTSSSPLRWRIDQGAHPYRRRRDGRRSVRPGAWA